MRAAISPLPAKTDSISCCLSLGSS